MIETTGIDLTYLNQKFGEYYKLEFNFPTHKIFFHQGKGLIATAHFSLVLFLKLGMVKLERFPITKKYFFY